MDVRYGQREQGRLSDAQTSHQASHQAEDVLRVVVTADNHLSAYTPKLTPQRLSQRRFRLCDAFMRVVDEAINWQAHLFIQAGDLFDTTDPRNLEREFVAAQLARLRMAGIHVFGVSGNHDTPRQRTEHGGAAPQGVYAELGGLHYFGESRRIQPELVEAAGMRIALAGLSNNPGAAPGGDPLEGVEVDDPAGALEQAHFGILILHAAIEGHGFPGENESIIRRASLERLPGFQIVVAGHVHAYARFQVGGKAVVVCGPTERMEFGEVESKPGFAYLECGKTGLRHAAHIVIPSQPRHVLTIRASELWPQQHCAPLLADSLTTLDANSSSFLLGAIVPVLTSEAVPHAGSSLAADVEDALDAEGELDPTQAILDHMKPFCTPEAMVRLRIEGTVTREQYRALDLRQVLLVGQRNTFSFELDESGLILHTSGSSELVARGERVTPRDTLQQVADEWIERAATPEDRALFAKTRERILASYEGLTGREVDE